MSFVYHVGSLETANMEPLAKHLSNRATGVLGTGLYVYLNKPDINSNDENIVNVFTYPWKKPVVIQSFNELRTISIISETVNNILRKGSIDINNDLRSLIDNIRAEEGQNGIAFFKKHFRSMETFTKVARRALQLSYKSYRSSPELNGGIQPITLILRYFGYDGVKNELYDDNVWGSVYFNMKTLPRYLHHVENTTVYPTTIIANANLERHSATQYFQRMKNNEALNNAKNEVESIHDITLSQSFSTSASGEGGRLLGSGRTKGLRAVRGTRAL